MDSELSIRTRVGGFRPFIITSTVALAFGSVALAEVVFPQNDDPSLNRNLAIPKCDEILGPEVEKIKNEFIAFGMHKGFYDPDLAFLSVDQDLVISRCTGFYTVGVLVELGGRGHTQIFFFEGIEPTFGQDRYLDTEHSWAVKF